MANNSNNQTTYLILDSLSGGSKYGLEIIEYISQRTGGKIILKKPSLYSSLTRMEKKGYISSSYWGESELGGKRHYYSITNLGKNYLEELSKDFTNFNFQTEIEDTEKPTAPIFLQQDNLFDMVKKEPTKTEPKLEQNNIIENQMDMFSLSTEQSKNYENKLNSTTTADDGKFLQEEERLTPMQEEQNKKIYDTSSELKKYRKRKSFSENQIEMSVVYEREEDRQIQKERIEQLKASMLSARDNAVAINQVEPEQPVQEEEIKDDAVLITNPPIEHSQIPIQRKITPPNIDINIYDDDLPAPKRDSSLEPTYKDMMAKLFERKKEKVKQNEIQTSSEPVGSFTDYDTLKKYYATHNIEFKEYHKSTVKRNHNTNFLNFINSCILLLLSGIGCSIFYGIVLATGNLKSATNFMFYTLPLLFLIYTVYTFIKYKLYPSRKPVLIYNSIVNWAVAVLATVIIFVINIICGMQYETMAEYLTSLLIPIWGVLLVFPINFYIKLISYKKFGK